ncbi:hypothetical protein SLE2022_264340 [Rubroshorea leprosula]
MVLKSNAIANNPIKIFLFLTFILISLFFLFFLVFFYTSSTTTQNQLSSIQAASLYHPNSFKVYVADLPRSLNYGLFEKYWSSGHPDSRIPSDPDHQIPGSHPPRPTKYPPYPENPLIKQYSAEYWILGDLETPEEMRTVSFAKRVFDVEEADVVFVPFFATLSGEMQLGSGNGAFRKKEGNEDSLRQKEVLDFVRNTDAWKRSGGRDHVFVFTDPVVMWHVRAEIALAVLLVVDFGGWYKLDSNSLNVSTSDVMMHHTQVSLLKDAIVPYTHLLPRLQLSDDQECHTLLLYFKGAKHWHRGGLVREKLWDLLVGEPGIVMEEVFCIPVIVSDNIELPFEGMIDYSEFSVFVAVSDALISNWLVTYLRSIPARQRDEFRRNMAKFQPIFEYASGHPGGVGPIPPDGAVNHIWKKVHQKLPAIKEAIIRDKRKPAGVPIPLRCHCT